MLDLVIGAGQGGSRLAKVLSDTYEIEARYLNLAEVDFRNFDVPHASKFVLDEGGTGRDPELGESFVRRHRDDLYAFLEDSITVNRARHVALCVGGGGGSGTGFLFPTLEYLIGKEKEVLLFYTLPQRREGLPAQPNAIKALNRMIETYVGRGIVKRDQIAPILIDNDYCQERYGQTSDEDEDYWSRVNRGVAMSLRRFYALTSFEANKAGIDMAAGYNSLDYREFMRILFFKDGFLDVREINFSAMSEVANLSGAIKTSSLLNGSMDINTTKAYIVSVALPVAWKGQSGISDMLNVIFDSVAKMTRTPFVLRSSYYSKKLKTAKVSLLLAGMSKSHGLDKHVKSAVKNVEKFRSKGDVASLNLSGLDF